MTVDARLAARAEAHGLTRRADGAWTRERGAIHYVGCDEEGWWSGDPSYGHYATEDAALSATLDRFDHESPDRKLPEPSPGAQLAEAVGDLNLVCGLLRSHASASVKGLGEDLAKAIAKVEALALPPDPDEGEVLVVALEYLLHLGVLPDSARPALVETLRQHPELIGEARLAWWMLDRGEWMLCTLHSNAYGAWESYVADVRPELIGRCWWSANVGGEERREGYAADAMAARAEVERLYPEWRILRLTPTEATPAETPEPLERNQFPEEPAQPRPCEQCRGLGEWVDPASRYGIASRCPRCHGSGREP